MSAIIRPYKSGDELGMAFAHSQSILVLCSKDYPAETVVKWAKKKPETYAKKASEGENFFVAEQGNRIVGLAGWQNDDLTVCYLHPAAAGQGIGRELFQAVEADYLSKTGNKTLKVSSTITAKPFYEAMGFTALEATKDYFSDGVTYLDAWKMIKNY